MYFFAISDYFWGDMSFLRLYMNRYENYAI